MPNWTYNNIYITGNQEDLNRLEETVKSEESEFDFDRIIPQPAIVKKSPDDLSGETRRELHGYSWRDWNIEHWNTKWNSCEVSMQKENNQLIYMFQTAWAAPWPVLMELAKQFPELKFEIIIDYEDYYGEPTQGVVIHNAKLISYHEIEHIYEEDEDGMLIDHTEDEEWKEADLEESGARRYLRRLLETNLR